MFTNPDPYIDLPYWTGVCHFCQNLPPLYLNDEETNPYEFMSYIQYRVHNGITRWSVHG